MEVQLTDAPPAEQAHHFVATALKPEMPGAAFVAMVCIAVKLEELPEMAPY